jgi:hypothetical protein
MSKLVVYFSFGLIQRVSVSSQYAESLYQMFPQHRGQMILIDKQNITAGRMVFAVLPMTVLKYLVTITRRGVSRIFS